VRAAVLLATPLQAVVTVPVTHVEAVADLDGLPIDSEQAWDPAP
jgi:hypothetical protein